MARTKKEAGAPIDLTKKVTLYAPAKAKHHSAGEEVNIHPVQKEHFIKQGYTETKPEEKSEPAKDPK